MAEQINITPMVTHARVKAPVVDTERLDLATIEIELGPVLGWYFKHPIVGNLGIKTGRLTISVLLERKPT